jgi:hypothetical protein
VPTKYEELVSLFQGIGGLQLEELFKIPAEIARIFETDRPSGYHCFQLEFTLPPNFAKNVEAALRRAVL